MVIQELVPMPCNETLTFNIWCLTIALTILSVQFCVVSPPDSATKLTKLVVGLRGIDESSEITTLLGKFLTSAHAAVTCFGVSGLRFHCDSGADRLLRGLRTNTAVTHVEFRECGIRFGRDHIDFYKQLADLVRNKSELSTLRLTDCNCFSSHRDFVDALAEKLCQHQSPLRCLDVVSTIGISSAFTLEALQAVMNAVAKSTRLERFTIGAFQPLGDPIVRGSDCRILWQSIPSLRAKTLAIQMKGQFLETDQQSMVDAIRKNFVVRAVECTIVDSQERWFSAANQAHVDVCLFRNQKLADWVENPMLLPQVLWPRAVKMSSDAGRDFLYRSLLAVVGRDAGLQQRGHKRTISQVVQPL